MPEDVNGEEDIYVYDRELGRQELISVSTGGGQANDSCFQPSISGSGRFVSFFSYATSLHQGQGGLFVRDRIARTTVRVGWAENPQLSADGKFVAFESYDALVAGDTNGMSDCYVNQCGSGEGWGSWIAPNQTGGNTIGDAGYRESRGYASGVRPIILVNGISASFLQGFFQGFLGGPGGDSQWAGFVANLVSDYADLGFSRYDPQTNPNGLIFVCDILDTRLSLWENARRLNSFIESKRNLPQFQGSPKFDVVGYSFGGLIARQWEHDFDSGREPFAYSSNAKRLRNLVTISTPHQGTPLANLWGWGGQESIPEMTTWAMEAYNKTFTSHLGTRYSRIAGDVDKWWLLLGKHHDRVIKVSSQTAADWIKAGSGGEGDTRILLGLSHCDPLGLWDDIRDASQTATAVYEAIYGGGGALGPQDQENQEPEVHDSLETVANLKPNTTVNRYVSTPTGAGSLGINVSWAEGDASVVAIEPGGRLINPTVAATDPNIDYEKEGNTATYVMRTPKPGLWIIRAIGASSIPVGGTECRMSASDQFTASALATTPVLVRLGSSGRFLVSLQDSGGKLLGGVVESTLTNPTGSTSSLTFYDDGAHGDSLANDGLYGSNLVPAAAPGTYSVQGRITGTRSYGTASRLFSTSFDASPESGRIQGLSAVQASDDPADSDAYYDLLRVSVKLNFASLGTYMLSGDLVGPQGQFIDSVTEVVEPAATGVFTSVLKFRGQVIGESMIDGPYTVQSVRLTDQTGESVLTDYKALLGTTAAYSKLQFETITARTASPASHFDGTSLISLPLDPSDPTQTIRTILGPNAQFVGPWQGNRLRGMAVKVAWRGARPSVASYLGAEDDTEFPIVFERSGAQSVGCPYNRPIPISRFFVKNVATGVVRTSTADAANPSPWVNWSFSFQQAGVWKLAKLSGGNDTKLRPWFGYRFSTNMPNLEITFRD